MNRCCCQHSRGPGSIWKQRGAGAGLGWLCKLQLPPTSMGLGVPQLSCSSRQEDEVAGRNGAAGAEPAALGCDPPAKLIGDRLKIQNAFEGPSPHSKCLEVKGVLGEQSRRASSIPHSPSTRSKPSQHRCWGQTKAWLAGGLAPHRAGPAPCWCQSPLPALRPAEESRQQAWAEALMVEAGAARGCPLHVPMSLRAPVPSQSCRLAAASSAPCPGAGSRGSANRQGHGSTPLGWSPLGCPGQDCSQHHQPRWMLLPL